MTAKDVPSINLSECPPVSIFIPLDFNSSIFEIYSSFGDLPSVINTLYPCFTAHSAAEIPLFDKPNIKTFSVIIPLRP